MLRFRSISSAASAKDYFTTALEQESYYSGELNTPGQWGGSSCQRLGLQGQVTRDQFFHLIEGLDPNTGENLTSHRRSNRRVGTELVFSVPKSYSSLAALTGDERFDKIMDEAVQETMTELEGDARVRVRKEGKNETRPAEGLVYAKYLHKTARPTDHGLSKVEPDPHWHVHVVIPNVAYDKSEGIWKAADIELGWRNASYLEAAFDARVAKKLRDLGLSIERTGGKGWEVAGVPASTTAKFSRRTAEIEQKLEELGGNLTADEKGRLGQQTRQRKENETSLDRLRASWINRLDDGEKQELKATLRGERPAPAGPDAKRALDYAVEASFERRSVASEKRLMEHALRYGVAGVTVEEAWRAAKQDRRLIRREHHGETQTTTKAVMQEEKRMVAWAKAGRGAVAPLVGEEQPITRAFLNEGQQKAVRHVWETKDRVAILRGGAGTGKTTLMQEAVTGIKQHGHPVQVLAPTAEASRGVLRKEGFRDADTVAKFLADESMQQRVQGGVIWVDEAGLLGAPTMAKLFDVAQQQKARVVLSGDEKQHGPIERGDSLRTLQSHAGVTPAEVKEIQRQQGRYKELVAAVEKGDEAGVEKGFEHLEERGWLKEVADETQRTAELAQEYADKAAGRFRVRNRKKAQQAQGKPAGKQKVLTVAPTHVEGERVTAAIRQELRERGRLGEAEHAVERWRSLNWDKAQRSDAAGYEAGLRVKFTKPGGGAKRWEKFEVLSRTGDEVRVRSLDGKKDLALPLDQAEKFQVYRRDWMGLSAGDQVRVTQGGRTKPGAGGKQHRLNTGALYEVAGFEQQTGDIKLTNGWVVDRRFNHLTTGYAVTSFASQGVTTDHVLLAASSASLPAVSREQFYVSVSRGKRGVSVYTDDVDRLKQAATDSGARMGALDLAEQAKKPPAQGATPTQAAEKQKQLQHREHTQATQQRVQQQPASKSAAPRPSPDKLPGS